MVGRLRADAFGQCLSQKGEFILNAYTTAAKVHQEEMLSSTGPAAGWAGGEDAG